MALCVHLVARWVAVVAAATAHSLRAGWGGLCSNCSNMCWHGKGVVRAPVSWCLCSYLSLWLGSVRLAASRSCTSCIPCICLASRQAFGSRYVAADCRMMPTRNTMTPKTTAVQHIFTAIGDNKEPPCRYVALAPRVSTDGSWHHLDAMPL